MGAVRRLIGPTATAWPPPSAIVAIPAKMSGSMRTRASAAPAVGWVKAACMACGADAPANISFRVAPSQGRAVHGLSIGGSLNGWRGLGRPELVYKKAPRGTLFRHEDWFRLPQLAVAAGMGAPSRTRRSLEWGGCRCPADGFDALPPPVPKAPGQRATEPCSEALCLFQRRRSRLSSGKAHRKASVCPARGIKSRMNTKTVPTATALSKPQRPQAAGAEGLTGPLSKKWSCQMSSYQDRPCPTPCGSKVLPKPTATMHLWWSALLSAGSSNLCNLSPDFVSQTLSHPLPQVAIRSPPGEMATPLVVSGLLSSRCSVSPDVTFQMVTPLTSDNDKRSPDGGKASRRKAWSRLDAQMMLLPSVCRPRCPTADRPDPHPQGESAATVPRSGTRHNIRNAFGGSAPPSPDRHRPPSSKFLHATAVEEAPRATQKMAPTRHRGHL